MIQFFAPDIEKDLSLPPEESSHCCKVLRKRVGEIISVTDGRGGRYSCEIISDSPKKTEVRIIEKIEVPKGWRGEIVLAVAPTKNADRMSWLVEKSVEIGVDKIIFVDCLRNERHKLSVERLRRVAVSAMKQSLKARLPEISEMISLSQFMDLPFSGLKVFGYCDDASPRLEFTSIYKPDSGVCILIGPEGDFSAGEVETLRCKGFSAVTFGDMRLRTETAAFYGLTAVHVIDSMTQCQ